MEESYRREKLTAEEEIYSRRNSKETKEIIENIRMKLYDLLANLEESRARPLTIRRISGHKSLPTEMKVNAP